ncbi:MAG: FAD-dependent oxidoreductase [bacterium]|nr:FAD-dependent oxidoreductase [bacterium]
MKLRFLDKKFEIGDVWSFFFEPIGSIEWLAGQSIRLEIPRKIWGVDERRFTIASAPHEEHLQITTRISNSEFKQNLSKLKTGDIIHGFNIEGDFVWQDSSKPKLFIAAGIGITPFRSLISDRINAKLPLNTTLLYSSQDQPAVFYEQLKTWQTKDITLRVEMTTERIDINIINSIAPAWLDSLIYVSGPETMVQELGKLLIPEGLPNSQLKTDQFTGYKS